MTRKDQIITASYDEERTYITMSQDEIFCHGAEWADSHPNWHKYPDEKPPLKQRILIYTTKGRIAETVWCQPMLVSGEPHGEPTFEDNRYNKHNVIAWMKRPEPPKFD